MADAADARRRAEEALAGWRTCLSIHDDDCFGCPEALADAVRALLAAWPEAKASTGANDGAARDALARVQWSRREVAENSWGEEEPVFLCPECDQTEARGHAPDCRIGMALAPPPPPRDAVREAAEVVRTILTAHDARLSESGALTYGPPSKGTGFVAAIQWLRRYDAARGGE